MPPRLRSRYVYTLGIQDTDGPEEQRDTVQLTERVPYGFRDFADNVQHVVRAGESLHILAARYFHGIEGAAELWWVIADFQPDPIHDPTIALAPGSALVIPSVRTVLENVFDEARRAETAL